MITDLINLICKYCNFKFKLRFLKINEEIKQIALRNIDELPEYLSPFLTDKILEQFPYLRKLKLNNNTEITNQAMQKLRLTELVINQSNINDDYIINMTSLKALKILNNQIITNFGLKFLNLKELCIVGNNNITYDGIKHMNLKILGLSGTKISDMDLKNMRLSMLFIFDNNITDEGIKDMKLQYLAVQDNDKVTEKGIKNMKLKELINYYGNIDLTKITNTEYMEIASYHNLDNRIIENIKKNGYGYLESLSENRYTKYYFWKKIKYYQ